MKKIVTFFTQLLCKHPSLKVYRVDPTIVTEFDECVRCGKIMQSPTNVVRARILKQVLSQR